MKMKSIAKVLTASSAIAAVLGSYQTDIEEQDNILIQRRPGAVAKTVVKATTGTADSDQLTELQEEVAGLKDAVLEMKELLVNKSSCCGCSSSSTQETQTIGLCAAFGDPHFTTFDGAHTILLPPKLYYVMWLVKSQDIWIQGLSKMPGRGNFMGFAVGGPFMQNKTLLVYNATLTGGRTGSIEAMYGGEKILETVPSDFESPFMVWAARRADWEVSLHDSEVLGIPSAINWDIGTWPSRFQNAPLGGVYYFKLPNNVEITASGVDFMTAVIRMSTQTGGQGGYCGNFNGDAADEFEPPPEGSIYEVLRPAWNTAVGEDLGEVPARLNMFPASLMTSLMQIVEVEGASNAAASKSEDGGRPGINGPNMQPCSQAQLAAAVKACTGIADDDLRSACEVDVCLTGSSNAVDSAGATGVMENQLADGRVPLFIGHGSCHDAKSVAFKTLATKDVRSSAKCLKLLRDFSGVPGVLGAQLQTEGSCELVLKFDVAPRKVKAHAPNVAFKQDVERPRGDTSKREFIAGVQKDLSYSCWRLD
mmetsp:Transcript_41623/g.89354  ORF Transcript_41623/g.89354 Transcript_41623/m.89354 type:complete len:535 (-) Transcript_41623:67-1671(-)